MNSVNSERNRFGSTRQLKRSLMKVTCAAAFLAFLAAWSALGIAQSYPTGPIKVEVGYPAGGGMDAIARIMGQKLSEVLGQQLVIVNHPGAAGTLAAGAVAKASPDGYTIYLAETGFLIAPSMIAHMPVDPVTSFTPVASVGVMPLVFLAAPNFPATNARELIALIKAHPGKYSYGSAGIGTVHHFAFELFMRAAGLQAVHVPYKGGAPMIPDLVSGRIPIGVLSVPISAPLVKNGKIRALALTTKQRVPSVIDWQPLAETLPGFDAAPRLFFLAPAGTPAAIVERLNEATRKVLAFPDVVDNFANQGTLPAPSSAEELGAQIATEVKRWEAIAKDAGIKPE